MVSSLSKTIGWNDLSKEKAEAQGLIKNAATKTKKTEDTINPVPKIKVASKAFAANTQQQSLQKPQQSALSIYFTSCIEYKDIHRLWECPVLMGKDSHVAGQEFGRSKALFLVFAW